MFGLLHMLKIGQKWSKYTIFSHLLSPLSLSIGPSKGPLQIWATILWSFGPLGPFLGGSWGSKEKNLPKKILNLFASLSQFWAHFCSSILSTIYLGNVPHGPFLGGIWGVQRGEPPTRNSSFLPLSHNFESVLDKFGMEPLAISRNLAPKCSFLVS